MVEHRIKPGDLVRRDADDLWRVLSVPGGYEAEAGMAECVCERPPLGWLRPDGTRGKPWASQGLIEHFVMSDLELLDPDTLDRLPAR